MSFIRDIIVRDAEHEHHIYIANSKRYSQINQHWINENRRIIAKI